MAGQRTKSSRIVNSKPTFCLIARGKPRNSHVLIGQPRDLNLGPPEYKSTVLSLRLLARLF